jgi:hypothetical protein
VGTTAAAGTSALSRDAASAGLSDAHDAYSDKPPKYWWTCMHKLCWGCFAVAYTAARSSKHNHEHASDHSLLMIEERDTTKLTKGLGFRV